ncbi:hypothetical protein H2248_004837 [Termitomyces sp. 'cryptogamus']|nr:hypothetical protein H2248_004837 [Termitomyces sp. 'cryptogamus']
MNTLKNEVTDRNLFNGRPESESIQKRGQGSDSVGTTEGEIQPRFCGVEKPKTVGGRAIRRQKPTTEYSLNEGNEPSSDQKPKQGGSSERRIFQIDDESFE